MLTKDTYKEYKIIARTILLIFIITICPYDNTFSVPINKSEKKDLLKIYLVELDKGECILIDIFGKKKILIDTGPKEPMENLIPRKYKKKKRKKKRKKKLKGLFPLIKKLKVKRLDFVIITYPHKNYIGNLPVILKHIDVKNVIDSAYALDSAPYIESLKIIESKNIKYNIARKDYTINIEGVNLEIVHPEEHLTNKSPPYERSIVLKMTYKDHSFLFTSAIGNKTIDKLMSMHNKFKNYFLKMPYNYKGEKKIIDFIKFLKPKSLYIPKKIYKKGIMNYLRHNNITSYNAFEMGNVLIKSNGKSYFSVM